jgi:hypothetical protein
MANETGNNPRDRQNASSGNRQAQGNRGDQWNQNTNASTSGARSSDQTNANDRSGVRTNTGSSMTDMQGRERKTNTNTQVHGQNTGNSRVNAPGQNKDERSVTAHNSGDGSRDQDENWSESNQKHRKAS